MEAEGIGVPASLKAVRYPAPDKIDVAFAEEPLAVYHGVVSIPAQLVLGGDASPGPRVARVNLRYQACDDQKC